MPDRNRPRRIIDLDEAELRALVRDEVERAVSRTPGGRPADGAAHNAAPAGWISVREFCRVNDVGRSTLGRWRTAGHVESKSVGGRVFVRWPDSGATTPSTPNPHARRAAPAAAPRPQAR